MKKIVALVLAMVMVLGLATTAFAAKGGEKYEDATINYNWNFVVTPEEDGDAEDATFDTYIIEAVALKNMKPAQKFFDATLTDVEKGDVEEVEVDGQDEFVKVAAEAYADVTIVDGKTITYYAKADTFNKDGYDALGVKVTLPVKPLDNADAKCNTLYAKDSAHTTFYFADGMLWVADKTAPYVLNVAGVAVKAYFVENMKAPANNEWIYQGHSFQFEKGYVNHDNDGTTADKDIGVVKVYCQNCKAEFAFKETDVKEVAVAVFGEDNYEFVTKGGVTVAIEKVSPAVPGVTGGSAVVTPDADSDKVESPKTFDAGIAMYVGMSVMAAAGSAVVLKKKD